MTCRPPHPHASTLPSNTTLNACMQPPSGSVTPTRSQGTKATRSSPGCSTRHRPYGWRAWPPPPSAARCRCRGCPHSHSTADRCRRCRARRCGHRRRQNCGHRRRGWPAPPPAGCRRCRYHRCCCHRHRPCQLPAAARQVAPPEAAEGAYRRGRQNGYRHRPGNGAGVATPSASVGAAQRRPGCCANGTRGGRAPACGGAARDRRSGCCGCHLAARGI